MIITREYVYECRSCGEKFRKVTTAEVNPALGARIIQEESERELLNQDKVAAHRCLTLTNAAIGLGDLVGVVTHE